MAGFYKLMKYLFLVGILILVYSLCEPYFLKITPYQLKNKALSDIKIVFATDFHVAPYTWEKWRLQKIIDTINAQKPDLVILGGDYVNRHTQNTTMAPTEIAKALQKIKAPKVAVLGNHDFYYGKNNTKKALENAAIPVLDNQNIKFVIHNKELMVAGVADYYTDKPDIDKALPKTSAPTIFVTHSPDVFPQLKNQPFTLALAGHTHGGQITLPFIGALFVPSDFGRRYTGGIYRENNKPLIVSTGLGTSLLPLRFNNRPEIVVVEFK